MKIKKFNSVWKGSYNQVAPVITSQLVYSVSNLSVPIDFRNDTRKKLFSFLWKNKKDKIKKVCLYQDYAKGGIRMRNLDLTLNALRLAWLPRLLNPAKQNCKLISDHFFSKTGES